MLQNIEQTFNIFGYTYTTVQKFGVSKIYLFNIYLILFYLFIFQEGHIQLIKSDCKDIYVTK